MGVADIRPVDTLTEADLASLLAASEAEGYRFVRTLWAQYQSGEQRFDQPTARLFGAFDGPTLVAIGGVHTDPYESQPHIGRIRHLYVLPDYRRRRVARRLVWALVMHARKHFRELTLRTLTDHGDAFFMTMEFTPSTPYPHATHWMDLNDPGVATAMRNLLFEFTVSDAINILDPIAVAWGSTLAHAGRLGQARDAGLMFFLTFEVDWNSVGTGKTKPGSVPLPTYGAYIRVNEAIDRSGILPLLTARPFCLGAAEMAEGVAQWLTEVDLSDLDPKLQASLALRDEIGRCWTGFFY